MTTSAEIANSVNQTVDALKKLYIAEGLTAWDAATNGTEQNLQAAADANAASMRFRAHPAAYQQYHDLDESGAAGDDKMLARQLRVLHYFYASGQVDPDNIHEISQLQMKLQDAYTNFRGQVDGKPITVNAIDKLLDEEIDSELRREAWEAGKQVGPVVAASIRQLARLRNKTAEKMGYANYHRMALTLDEVDPDWLYVMLDDLAARTDEPFGAMKADLDVQLSKQFGVPVNELRAWHYSDLFFQRAPKIGNVDLDPYFKDQNLEELALKTYDGLGMDVRDIIARSDMYERPGKDQHAFCMHVDREGDVRTLNNLQPILRWMDTLLHELGHGVYDKYIPHELPWLLRTPAHILYTEAMAILMGDHAASVEWLTKIRGLSPAEAEPLAAPIIRQDRRTVLIFARWVMVMVNFERAMYEDPERDLDTRWWDLVEKYQFIPRPEGRAMPDWATKYHVALAPAYYHNYLIGKMVGVQWERWINTNAGDLINNPLAGDFFRDRIFKIGATVPWNDALEYATGEKLNIQYYVDKYVTQEN